MARVAKELSASLKMKLGSQMEEEMKSEQDLLKLCEDIQWSGLFESAECYGIGKHLREYGYYPQWLPLCVSTDHGPSQRDVPTFLDLRATAPAMLYHSQRLVNEWRKLADKKCEVMFSPFVFYRRKNRIDKAYDARGTLAFPVHSTEMIETDCDMEDYIRDLLALPKEFHPISACLYYLDIRRGVSKIFEKYGIPVYTAGHIYDYTFT